MSREKSAANKTEHTLNLSRTLFLPMGAPPLSEIISLDSTPRILKNRTVKNAAEPLLVVEGIVELELRYIIYRETALAEMSWEETINELTSAAQEMSRETATMPADEHTVTISFPWELSVGFPQLTPRNFSPSATCRNLQYTVASPRAVELGMELFMELHDKTSVPEIKTIIKQPVESAVASKPTNTPPKATPAAPLSRPPHPTAKPMPEPAQEPVQENTTVIIKSFSYKMKFYRVKESDTLWDLADKCGVPASLIAEINDLGNTQLAAGMFISLPLPR